MHFRILKHTQFFTKRTGLNTNNNNNKKNRENEFVYYLLAKYEFNNILVNELSLTNKQKNLLVFYLLFRNIFFHILTISVLKLKRK
jgi:hypothetical protein